MTSFAANGSTLFASVGSSWNNGFAFPPDSGGVFISTDGGDHWIPVNTGLPERDVQSIRVNSTFVYAGLRSHGVWRRLLSDISTGVARPENAVPGSFVLWQNYPNPFNPNSDIRYQISDVAHVRLVVYDILGREVATLVNERKAPGTYEVKFGGAGLSSGVYIYRMTAGKFTETRRMILLK